jgi:hypothetical protein
METGCGLPQTQPNPTLLADDTYNVKRKMQVRFERLKVMWEWVAG